mmetsp:Transcript_26075/g.49254  ORF Transcript_26075/g.49254 Transcript_26075/m.49254 type:complete len:206 (+) Transcript_26075:41-658(+)
MHTSFLSTLFSSLLCVARLRTVSSTTPDPIRGPFQTAKLTFDDPEADKSDQRVLVVYPVGANSTRLISYAHGLGNNADDYQELFDGLASFGYTVTSHWACKEGCKEDRLSLKDDPPFFGNYYKQQLLTIDWAREQKSNGVAPFDVIDFRDGVGIAGHSMGGPVHSLLLLVSQRHPAQHLQRRYAPCLYARVPRTASSFSSLHRRT